MISEHIDRDTNYLYTCDKLNSVEHEEMYRKKKPRKKDMTSFKWMARNDFILFSKEPKLVNIVEEIQTLGLG